MSPDVHAALHRLLVDLERPVALDEWRLAPRRETPTPGTSRHRAVSVKDNWGRDLTRAA